MSNLRVRTAAASLRSHRPSVSSPPRLPGRWRVRDSHSARACKNSSHPALRHEMTCKSGSAIIQLTGEHPETAQVVRRLFRGRNERAHCP